MQVFSVPANLAALHVCRLYYMHSLGSLRLGGALAPGELSLTWFVRNALARMSAAALGTSLGTGSNSALLEAAYQFEFYKAACAVLAPPSTISPCVGAVRLASMNAACLPKIGAAAGKVTQAEYLRSL